MLDAVGVTLVRLITRQGRFLQWETAAAAAARARRLGIRRLLRARCAPARSSPASALAGRRDRAAAGRCRRRCRSSLLWAVAPLIAYQLSSPRRRRGPSSRDEDRDYLQTSPARPGTTSRPSSADDDHWLPPDNVQSIPSRASRIARRRPTSAWACSPRCRRTTRLHRCRRARRTPRSDADHDRSARAYEGHLLNWYDTQTLMPLLPQYVSTVDSGNSPRALLTLSAALRELAQASPTTRPAARGGALDVARRRAAAYFDEMHFGFLYDRQRQLFSIGYRLRRRRWAGRLDPSFYDLLASEARLASFIAIAKGDVPSCTGSTSAAWSPACADRRRCCRGAPRCSST